MVRFAGHRASQHTRYSRVQQQCRVTLLLDTLLLSEQYDTNLEPNDITETAATERSMKDKKEGSSLVSEEVCESIEKGMRIISDIEQTRADGMVFKFELDLMYEVIMHRNAPSPVSDTLTCVAGATRTSSSTLCL